MMRGSAFWCGVPFLGAVPENIGSNATVGSKPFQPVDLDGSTVVDSPPLSYLTDDLAATIG